MEALIGVIVGATLTAALGLVAERLRWQHEAHLRHEEWRRADHMRIRDTTRQAYVQFVEAVQVSLGLHARLGVAAVAKDGVSTDLPEDLAQDALGNNDRLANAIFTITLLAPAEVAAAASHVQGRLYELRRLSIARDELDAVRDAILGVSSSLSGFRQLARRDLDLPPDDGEIVLSSP